MERIMLAMSAAAFSRAEEAVTEAAAKAASPQALSVALVLAAAPDEEETRRMASLPSPRYLVGNDDPWQAVGEMWQGETFLLMASPDMRFERHWDRELLREWKQVRRYSAAGAVLTGFLPRQGDAILAVCPVAADRFDAQGRLIPGRGVPLRYAAAPELCALIHPAFCFAPAAFYRDRAEEDCEPFLAAFRRRWAVFTLASPCLRLVCDSPAPPIEPPPESAEALRRFAVHFGIDFEHRVLTARAREGLYRSDLQVPTRVSARMRLQESLRLLDNISSKLTPLTVTAWLTLPDAEDLPEQELARFRRLAAMRNVPLVCYADGAGIKRILPGFPNTRAYKSRYGLPSDIPLNRENASTYFRLSRPFLLAAAREHDMRHSHYVWMDFGYLRYPVWERAAVDWDNVCGERIVLAMVNGVPDLSMFSVPDALVLTLCRELSAYCQQEAKKNRALPDEGQAWIWMMSRHPEWFEAIDLPGVRELFGLTMPGRDEEWR